MHDRPRLPPHGHPPRSHLSLHCVMRSHVHTSNHRESGLDDASPSTCSEPLQGARIPSTIPPTSGHRGPTTGMKSSPHQCESSTPTHSHEAASALCTAALGVRNGISRNASSQCRSPCSASSQACLAHGRSSQVLLFTVSPPSRLTEAFNDLRTYTCAYSSSTL